VTLKKRIEKLEEKLPDIEEKEWESLYESCRFRKEWKGTNRAISIKMLYSLARDFLGNREPPSNLQGEWLPPPRTWGDLLFYSMYPEMYDKSPGQPPTLKAEYAGHIISEGGFQ